MQGFAPVIDHLERALMDATAATEMMPAMAPPAPPPSTAAGFNWKLVAAVAFILVAAPALYFALRPAAKDGSSAAAIAKAPAPAASLSLPSGDMVLIPAGTFQFGKDKQPVELPAFYMDKTEVTNGAYTAFAKVTGHALPEGFAADKPEYPVISVSFVDARQFAEWAGKRLPTAKEWEKAARGTDGRLFPWGNDADESRANVNTRVVKPANSYSA